MLEPVCRAVLCVSWLVLTGVASAQESEPDPDAPDSAPLENCFAVPAVLDMDAFSDSHLYVRTRGGNHYLVTTEHCPNLQRSSRRGRAGLVPYGRTVCENDGSHLIYDSGGREQPCPILLIERVAGREEARERAELDGPPVEVEQVTPEESDE